MTHPMDELGRRIRQYLTFEDCSPGGHSDAVGANAWELLAEAADALEARPTLPALGMTGWQPIETAPKDGGKFDAWAVHPDAPSLGARFSDVQMRGDKSGYGVVLHMPDGVRWEYLEREGPTYPIWRLTHWRPLPEPPATPTQTEIAGNGAHRI